MVRRFHADPRVQATELLLQERVPRHAPITQPRPAEATRVAAADARRGAAPLPLAAHAVSARAVPVERRLHRRRHQRRRRRELLPRPGRHAPARGRDARSRAASSSTCATCAAAPSGRPTYQPTAPRAGGYVVTFQAERAVFRRRDDGIATQLEIAVSPEDDVEVRRLAVTNQSDRLREIEVTSYVEIVLAPPADDLAHPAFGKLFIETEYLPESAALICARRPRVAARTPGCGRCTC